MTKKEFNKMLDDSCIYAMPKYEEKITITLPDGTEIKGTPNNVRKMGYFDKNSNISLLDDNSLAKLGYYRSDSKGILEIKLMNTLHIRNAILKIYREWIECVAREEDICEVIRYIGDGPDSIISYTLYDELCRREPQF